MQMQTDLQNQNPQHGQEDEYSLIHEGDSLVQQLDAIEQSQARPQRQSKPMTEYGGAARPNRDGQKPPSYSTLGGHSQPPRPYSQ